MSTRIYHACLKTISEQHGQPPVEFLDTLVDTLDSLPDEVFAKNSKYDIYSVVHEVLGPYTDLLHRKAVMCEVLRVVAAFESDWDWNEGVDIAKPKSKLKKEAEETGAFQVSSDSMSTDKSLRDCVDRVASKHDVDTFISAMKTNHPLAVEYCARLFRFDTRWCGTVNNKNMVVSHVSRDAVQEFKSFLTLSNPGQAVTPLASSNDDAQNIDELVRLAMDEKEFKTVQALSAHKLLVYDGDKYPTNGCAITLAILMQKAGIDIKDEYMAITLTNIIRNQHKWQVIPVGHQQRGDVGTTCGNKPNHGYDHIYLVLDRIDADKMLIADNQEPKPHHRWASGTGGKTPTKYFLRAL